MYREIIQFLTEWKDRKNRKPLILRGARQVGKTYSINEFAESYFNNYIKINFEEQIELKSLFKKLDIKSIIDELSILHNTDIIPGQTLLFFDEVQTCPEAILSLRYFYEHYPNLHIVAAGSLLDHALNEMNYSMPVGRVEFCYMYPMNFKEFLIALSQNKLVNYIEKYTIDQTFSEIIHDKLLKLFRLYLFIGGMPEAVQTYIKNEKLTEVERIHNNILTTLQYDFAKYGTKKQQEYLLTVLRYSAYNIGKKVKYSNIDRETRSVNLKTAFIRLELSRIIHLIRHTNAAKIPLTERLKENIYKPLFLDVGLANHLSGIKLINLEILLTENEGAIAEQFIGQELLTLYNDYIDPKLYYWIREEKNANAEIDYIYQYNNSIFPIEVKAGKSGSLKSLHTYLFDKNLKIGIRFNLDVPSTGAFTTKTRTGKKQGELKYTLISLPLYMCSHLPKLLQSL